jgi:outer membrane protein assembly factor BamB
MGMMIRFRYAALTYALLAVLSSVAISEEYWSQYRGPRGDGTSLAKGLPTTWSETEHIKWKTPFSSKEWKAWSSPVVWRDQIWFTNAPPFKSGTAPKSQNGEPATVDEPTKLYAVCLDLESGKVLHNLLIFDIPRPQYCIERNSNASSTPCIEEGRVYVHFGAHGTACLDTKTGKPIWKRQDLKCDHFRGAASSPVLWQDLLILTFDGFDFQYLTALNKETGETVWRTDRKFDYGTDNGDAMKAYSTPTIVDTGKRIELISPSAGATAAYDPRSGKELWRVKSMGMNSSCRPAVGGGMAFVGTADGGMGFFAVKLGGSGDVTGSSVMWKQTKGAPRYSSPIFVDGLVYTGNENGIISCLDAETGELLWPEKRLSGLFMPSPIYADGKLYFFSEQGKCYVLRAGREFKLLATNTLSGGSIMASPAVAGKSLIVRTTEGVYRIEE